MRSMVKKIMIVDDESGVRYTIKNGIEALNENYQVIPVENGMKCLDLLKSGQIPDLILLDVMMPEMSGWKTFDIIRENKSWENIPIIFLTARTDKVAKHAGEFLAEDFIEKPAKMPDLIKRIDKFINK